MTLAYRVDGPDDAPALLLSGSLGTTMALWEPQLARFATHFRVVRHDQPGHGSSTVPDRRTSIADIGRALLGVLDTAGIECTSVCGLSMGGMVGLWLAANAPDRIDRLVLACTGARLGSTALYDDRAALVRREGVGAIAQGSRERWFTPSFRDSEVAAHLLDELRAIDPEGYARCCEAVGDFDFRQDLARVEAPALVIVGGEDPLTTPDVVQTLLNGLRRSSLLTIPHAGHLAIAEQPDAFVSATLEHLTRRS